MRKISLAGYGFLEKMSTEETFALLERVGFDAIDYPLYGEEKGLEFAFGDKTSERAKAIRSAAEDHGVVIGQTHAPYGYREEHKGDVAAILDMYRRAAEATALLGAKHMVVHPLKFNDCIRDYRREECFDLNIEIFQRLTPILKETGVTALLENMFVTEHGDGWFRLLPTIYSSGEELRRAADILGDSYGVCWDSGHAFITKEDILGTLRTIGGRLMALHLHDNTGDRDDHLPPHFGKMPMDEVVSGLKEIGYAGNLNFEVRFTAVPTEMLEAAMRYVYAVGAAFRRRIDGE